jgi:hypothetical protein
MGKLIQKTDFVGKFQINQNSYTQLDSYIDKYEQPYLMELLGAELYELFIADLLNGKPQKAEYLSIYNIIVDQDCGKLMFSEGMVEMLKGFIYFEFVRDDKYKHTPSGIVVNRSDISREAGFSEFDIYGRYNDAVKNYDVIQWYIQKYKSDYPEFNGVPKSLVFWC